ncbi:MAG: tRNA dihydrouridine(20/20a) synthase DusA, partial [Spongiibacteraceae bacterium]
LMARPSLVADCVKAMKDVSDIPITVKHRIGIDDQEGYGPLQEFVAAIDEAGTDAVIVHARKAWLQGLSPKENREIPPLNYDFVYQLKQDFPALDVIINGGIHTLDDAISHLDHVDGIMMGRSAYQQPYILGDVDSVFYQAESTTRDRLAVLRAYYPYVESQLSSGSKLNHMSRHLLGLFNGEPGGKLYRRYVSQHAHQQGAGVEVLEGAAHIIEQELLKQSEYKVSKA